MIINGYNILENGFLFEITIDTTVYRFSTVHGYWNQIDVDEYLPKIIKDSFSGVTMRLDLTSRLYAPSDISFQIDNTDGTYDGVEFKGEYVTVRELVNAGLDELDEDTGVRSWKFLIKTAVEAYGIISISAIDLFQKYATGYYPTTPTIASIFPGDMKCADDMACVPKIFDSAWIPVAPGAYNPGTGAEWFYIISKGSWNALYWDLSTVYSPPEKNNASWDLISTYDYDGYTLEGADGEYYIGVQFTIHASEVSGSPDSNGIWVSNNGVLSPILKYDYNADSAIYPAGPALNLYYTLIDIGITAGEINYGIPWATIDSTIQSKAASGTDTYIKFGLSHKEPVETFISEYLMCWDMYMSFAEKVDVHLFSADSIETFATANIIKDSFTVEPYESENVDGGIVAFVRYDEDPDNILGGQAMVPIYTGQDTPVNPSGDVLKFRFRIEDPEIPTRFGQLYFQKKYDISHKVSFEASAGDITAFTTIRPGQVVTVDDTPYGYSDIVITEIHFAPDLTVRISGNVYNHLEDLEDVTPVSYTPLTVTGGYTIGTYVVDTVNDSTVDMIFDGDQIHFPTGRFVMDAQDAFQAIMSADQSNITAGTTTTVEFDDETQDGTGAFDESTYTYTAQGHGWRQFNVNVRMEGIDQAATAILLSLVTSNETFYHSFATQSLNGSSNPSAAFSQLAYMDNGDEAYVQIHIYGGGDTLDILAGSSFFSGFYVFDNTGITHEEEA